jgi:hypothetical protein
MAERQIVTMSEKEVIERAIKAHGTIAAAAKALDVPRRTLQRRMALYKIEGTSGRPRRPPIAEPCARCGKQPSKSCPAAPGAPCGAVAE